MIVRRATQPAFTLRRLRRRREFVSRRPAAATPRTSLRPGRRWGAVLTAALTCGLTAVVGVSRATPAGATPTMLCGQHQSSVAENSFGQTTTTYLTAGQSLQITGTGSIWAGYLFIGPNGPTGMNGTAGNGYPAPNARPFSLLARVGSLPWTYIGSSGTVTNTGASTEQIEFRTNDNIPGNGSGAFTATYTTCDLSTAPASQYSVWLAIAKHSFKCLTVAGYSSADGANVDQEGCESGLQGWTVRPVAGSSSEYEIVSATSGKCLDVANYGTADASNVQQWDCLGGTNQQWSFLQISPGWYEVIGLQSGKCLDVSGISQASGANVFIWDCLQGANQQWDFHGGFA